MEIVMARGDILTQAFTVTEGTQAPEAFDEIYFTVKKSANDRDFLFQKKLSDGSIYEVETGKYQFTIEPEDTNNMAFGSYGFDIELIRTGTLKRTFCGEFVLTKEYTHYYNEGV